MQHAWNGTQKLETSSLKKKTTKRRGINIHPQSNRKGSKKFSMSVLNESNGTTAFKNTLYSVPAAKRISHLTMRCESLAQFAQSIPITDE
ncbi:unnamed protein product [Ceratitis capitata]|uniref:(Mediterranean fruit fly) hypothetical protein n=1 Tax=Ceratitis capitata TaxID=7213 RepID=A0A811V8Z6_CERCA|nr:unnamed protein product [Ceratitis capitata]